MVSIHDVVAAFDPREKMVIYKILFILRCMHQGDEAKMRKTSFLFGSALIIPDPATEKKDFKAGFCTFKTLTENECEFSNVCSYLFLVINE